MIIHTGTVSASFLSAALEVLVDDVARSSFREATPGPDAASFCSRTGAAGGGGHSRFGRMAECSQQITAGPRSRLLAELLAAACVQGSSERALLRPLWEEEAMQRAPTMLTLVLWLARRTRYRPYDAISRQLEFNLAADLAALYRSLAMEAGPEAVPCSTVLREVVSNLVALFGPAAGAIEFRTDLVSLRLPDYKRRALVLAASELVVNALRHGFTGRHNGRLVVTLRAVGCDRACLIVAEDGVGYAPNIATGAWGIAHDLAGVLEATLLYRLHGGGGTVAEISFPVEPRDLSPCDTDNPRRLKKP